ncbi:P-loop containing nucleoside triphosphate hydrolase protein [Delphinella strobiligena]|nr:P-loop containing nucleoside triphosphate hydrolase protein [Delphinella strobiligena]
MSLAASRMLLRRPQVGRIGLRHASTTSEAAQAASNTASKAKDTVGSATSSASQGLSKVTSSASSGLSRAGAAAGSALNSIGGRTGKLIGFVQSLIPPTVYYSKVGLELGKLIFHGQKMSPPNMATFQTYGQNLLNGLRNPSAAGASNPFQAISKLRSLDNQQLATAGVVAAEIVGSDVANTSSKSSESKTSKAQSGRHEIDGAEKVVVEEQVQEDSTLSQEACRELLGQHKVKVTLLSQPPSQPSAVVEKKSKKKAKHTPATTKSRTQIYPTPVMDFRRLRSHYHMSRQLSQNIQDQGYTTTTEVQLAALPLMLGPADRLGASQQAPDATSDLAAQPISIDLLTIAPTGSGKTLAFMIPLIQALLRDRHQSTDSASNTSRAIVLAPTKELATQIVNEGRKLALNTGIKITNIRKGMHLSESDQSQNLPIVKADILVSTPLALLNALGEESNDEKSWTDFHYMVLDEADVLLDPLFRDQTQRLWNLLSSPKLRVSFWSATMGSNIEELVKATMDARAKRLSDLYEADMPTAPLVRLVVGLKDSAVPNIDHRLIYAATEQGKLMALRQILHPASSRADGQPILRAPFLVFTQTIERAVALHSELQYDIPAEAGGISRIAVLHSDLSETARDRVMTRFRKGEVWILITTDLLSRGVDFRGINGVVNYDVPTSAAAYVHRVGRTGRAGREGGVALTYYTDDDVASIKTVANIIAASQKLRGSSGDSESVQQWLLDALPTPSKRDKQQLKKRGVESRRSTKTAKDVKPGKTGAGKTRISTKSGYIRKLENNRRGAIEARQAQAQASDADSE